MVVGDAGGFSCATGILIVSGNLEVVTCNSAAAGILGFTSGELVGKSLLELSLYAHLKDYFQGGSGFLPEIALDGRRIAVEVSSLDGNTAGFTGYAVILKDATEDGCVEEAFREQERLAVVGRMAAGIVHELRNPMTAIRGFAQLLKEKKGYETWPYVDYIMEEIDNCSRIIGDFLKLARPNPPCLKGNSVNVLIAEVAAVTEPRAFLQNVKVETIFSPDLPDCLFDAAQMKQVFLNLVDNALEAMKGGGTLQFITRRFDSAFAEVTVRDTGCGIPEYLLKKIGLPFFSTREGGTGLGLFICQSIVQAHKGRMEVESEEGKGTAFRIYIPYDGPAG